MRPSHPPDSKRISTIPISVPSVGHLTGLRTGGSSAASATDLTSTATTRMASDGLKKNLYDSYIRAFRWASDRITDRGVICCVSNGSYIDGNYADGFRRTQKESLRFLYPCLPLGI